MNKPLKIVIISLASISALALGTYAYLKYQASLLMDYCYSLIAVTINKITFQEINIDLLMEIGNKSSLDFVIGGYELDVNFNGKKVARIKNSGNNQLLKARSISNIKLMVVFNPSQIFKDAVNAEMIAQFLTNPNSSVIGVHGKITARTSGIIVNDLPVDITTTIAEIKSGGSKSRKCVKPV